jgi:5'-nucleotidase / UDP-sugar diphosphatase
MHTQRTAARSGSLPDRLRVGLIGFLAIAMLVALMPPPSSSADEHGFSDVPESNVHSANIAALAELEILVGYPDGTFRPRNNITRGQLASVLARAAGLESVRPAGFTDTAGHAHEGAIGALAEADIVQGYPDRSFRPNENIRRDHVAVILASWLDLDYVDEGPFQDVTRYEGQINALWDLGIISGTSATTFHPASQIRRDQTASLVYHVLETVALYQDADFVLTVLHANDGESALLPTDDLPGAARFVADLQSYQDRGVRAPFAPSEADLGVVTVSSGDNYLAGPRLNASLENDDVFYDALVYTEGEFDAMTIGNHEFDFGPDLLADFIEATGDIPFISANLDFSGEPRLSDLEDAGRIAGSTVVTTAGRDVGIVGATTTQLDAISSPRNVTVSEVLPAVQAEVDALRDGGVEIILLSSHLQDLNEELTLVPQLRHVDAVIGGGGGEDIRGQYPAYAEDADGVVVPVVTTPGDYADIGRLQLAFDAGGDLIDTTRGSALRAVRLAGPVNEYIRTNVEAPVAAHVAALADNEIATTEVPLDGRRQNPGVRDRETNLGSLLADGLLYAARERAAEFGVPEADIALQNGGGMRQEQIIQPGPVTELDTFDIAAFANFVSVAQVTGTELKSALERSVSAQPNAAGFHGQWAGVKFNFDTSRQAQTVDFLTQQITQEGERIWDAVVTKVDGSTVTLVEDGVLLAPDEVFTMASISFIFDGGGDGYFALDLPYTTLGFTYQQALYNRFVALGTVTAADYPDVSVNTSDYTRFGPVGSFSVD